MTTAAFNLTYDNTSDATFRTWAAALDTQILAMGWVHTTDTGQANLATMTRSATIGTNYTLYKTNDGVSPALIMRVEWSEGTTTIPGISVSAGYATDGAGNLTGTAVSGRWTSPNNAASDTTPRTCVISGTTSRLAFTLNMSATNLGNTIHVAIERNKTTAGVDTNTGLLFTMICGTATAVIGGTANQRTAFLYLPTSGGVPAIEAALPVILTNNASGTNTFGATTGAGVPVPLAGAAQNPGLNHLVCLTAEQPTRDTTISVAMYDGSSHTYYAVGPNLTTFSGIGGTQLAGCRLLQRYE